MQLSKAILEHLFPSPEGTLISAKELLHLGSRQAVDQALSRLVKRGQLLRVGRGMYVRPIETRFGTRTPAVGQILEGIATAKGETIATHGATAANSLGLTTQVPIRLVYLTSGRSRSLQVGKQIIELRHAPKWQLNTAGLAGDTIRALAWLGETRAIEAIKFLRHKLPLKVQQELMSARQQLPTWLAQEISRLVVNA